MEKQPKPKEKLAQRIATFVATWVALGLITTGLWLWSASLALIFVGSFLCLAIVGLETNAARKLAERRRQRDAGSPAGDEAIH